ncbi:MAG: ribonuclease HI family protein [Candidatus Baltobacteraceae bacterium]
MDSQVPRHVTLFADGGARRNPGPAAGAAVLIDDRGTVIEEAFRYLGHATNNVAEWNGLLAGLEAAVRLGVRELTVRLDSELVVKQLLGEYRVKNAALQPLHRRALELLRDFERVDIGHVPRRQNKLADALVNRVLDAQQRSESERADAAL